MICDMLDSLALGNSSVKTAGKLEIAGSISRSKAGSKAVIVYLLIKSYHPFQGKPLQQDLLK